MKKNNIMDTTVEQKKRPLTTKARREAWIEHEALEILEAKRKEKGMRSVKEYIEYLCYKEIGWME